MNLIKNNVKNKTDLEELINQVLVLANKNSDESEVSIIKTQGITVSTRYGTVENVEFNNNEILKVTVVSRKKRGTAFSNNLSKTAVIDTVYNAIDIARYTAIDKYNGIADKESLECNPVFLDLYHPIELNIQFSINLACIAEKVALKYDKRIVRTEGGKFDTCLITKVFGNSHGVINSYKTSQYSLSCSVVAESDNVMEQNYAYTLSRSYDKLNSPEWVGIECAKRTLRQLGSKKIKTMESSVLFMSDVAVSLFKHLAEAIHGTNVYRKSTFLLNYLKKNIFPSWLSIKEFPHVLQGIGSVPFDNEGVRVMDRTVVKNGMLNTWLLDTYSARNMDLKSTGHSGGIYNWYISYQDIEFKELVKKMYCGLIITNIMGQGVNIVTGDYSRGISGLWVDKGVIQYPVNEVTISGNLKKIFSSIIAISNDIETRSNIHCGSVLIDSMKIAGI